MRLVEAFARIVGRTAINRSAANAAYRGGQNMGCPAIESVGALADWLWVEVSQLEWFADLKGLGRCAPLDHYHYRILPKRSGNIRFIEAPKRRLEVQRQILEWILDRIPIHPAAHGFVKARSIKTFVTPHVQQSVVLRMDLQDFFPSFAEV